MIRSTVHPKREAGQGVGSIPPLTIPAHQPQSIIVALRKLFVLILLLAVAGCDSSDPAVDEAPKPGEPIMKSAKRGIAYNMQDAADFEALKSGVSWWYNWHHATTTPPAHTTTYQMEYLPMLWGNNAATDFEQVKTFIQSRPGIGYLLVLNEPNLTDQANMTPQRAAEEWVKYEKVISDLEAAGRNIKLVGPQMTWGTMIGLSDPVFWLDQFYAYYRAANGGRDPRIDYLAFHWYDYGLETQLNRLQKYGKPIWITEMANWNDNIDTVEKQIEQMTQMVTLAESRSDVFRYAWFMGRWPNDVHHTSIFQDAAGQLTALGQAYINLPY